MTAKYFSFRLSWTYALMMIGSGVQLPFLPLWLKAKGFDTAGIAMVVAGMMASRLIGAPLFAWIADHFGNRRLVIQLCAGLALVSYICLAMAQGFSSILAIALIASFAFAPVFPLTEGFSVDGAVTHGIDYGRVRRWASLSFLIGSLSSGLLLTRLAPEDTAWLMAFCQLLSLGATFLLPPEPNNEPAHERKTSEAAQGLRARDLFFASSFPLLLLATGLGQASHAMLYSFSSVYWQSLGFSSVGIGVLWSAAVLAEVALLSYSNIIVEKFGPGRLMLIGMAGGFIRWIMMGFVTSFPLILMAQMLHALSFATTHLGTMHVIRLMAPPQLRNRAQGINAALSGGILMSCSTLVAGHFYGLIGVKTYFVMAVMSVVAMGLAYTVLRISPRAQAAAAA
jgi:MFS transporter, PPP family, 3-phenylpropionic acid transporter